MNAAGRPTAGQPADPLGVEDLRHDLGRRSAGSGLLAVSGRGLQLVFSIASVAVLARLLTPADFGILAMVMPVVVLANGLLGLATPAAVLFRDPLSSGELSRAFWFAARFNLAAVSAVGLAGLGLAAVFDEPRVLSVALAWVPVLYLLGLASFPEALLKRRLRFGVVVGINTVSLGVGAGAAVVAAILGAGYWALVLQYLVSDLIRSTLLWIVSPWRPESPGHVGEEDFHRLRDYGGQLAAYRALAWFGHQFDRLLVGWVGGATALGLYDNARRWAWFPFFELYRSLTDVAVSSFSRLPDDPERYRAFVRRAFGLVLGISLPIVAWTFVDAPRIILLLLGDQWLAATVFMRLMCVAAFAGSLTLLTQWLYNSLGLTGRQFRWALVQSAGTVAGLLIGALYGPLGVTIGFTVATVALAVPSAAYCVSATPVGLRDVLGSAARPMAFSALAAAGTAVVVPLTLRLSPLAGVLLSFIAFIGIYTGSWLVAPSGRQAVREIGALVAHGLAERRKREADGP